MPNGAILENGGIAVSGNTIASIGSRSGVKRGSGDRAVNLGECLLLPGTINLHTHLEHGAIRETARAPDETFASWSSKRDSRIRNMGSDTIISTVKLGIREALANGITTVVDSSRTDIPPIVLRDEPIRSWAVHEVHPRDGNEREDLAHQLSRRIKQSRRMQQFGMGPYALYSLTPESHRILIALTQESACLWTCHIAESAEELQAFSEQAGDLHFQMTRNRPWPYAGAKRGALYYGLTNKLIPNNGIIYHCNYVSGEELSLLAAKNVAIVLCPRYTTNMGHKHFPLDVALRRGVNICVGTESPESSRPMNLFDELYHLKTRYPHIPAWEMIKWVTIGPARALGWRESLGSLEEGKMADIVGVRFSHDPGGDILEELLQEEPDACFVMVNGEELIIEA